MKISKIIAGMSAAAIAATMMTAVIPAGAEDTTGTAAAVTAAEAKHLVSYTLAESGGADDYKFGEDDDLTNVASAKVYTSGTTDYIKGVIGGNDTNGDWYKSSDNGEEYTIDDDGNGTIEFKDLKGFSDGALLQFYWVNAGTMNVDKIELLDANGAVLYTYGEGGSSTPTDPTVRPPKPVVTPDWTSTKLEHKTPVTGKTLATWTQSKSDSFNKDFTIDPAQYLTAEQAAKVDKVEAVVTSNAFCNGTIGANTVAADGWAQATQIDHDVPQKDSKGNIVKDKSGAIQYKNYGGTKTWVLDNMGGIKIDATSNGSPKWDKEKEEWVNTKDVDATPTGCIKFMLWWGNGAGEDQKGETRVTLEKLTFRDKEGNVILSMGVDNKSISKATVSVSASSLTYTGKAVKPALTVKDGTKTLKANTDYTVQYFGSTKAGTATAVITGKGSYNGQVTKTYKIAAKSISKTKISAVSAKTYTGKAIKPTVVVKDGTKTLKNKVDYTVSYGTNKIGKGTITITGKGNYAGKVTKTFAINPRKTTVTVKSTTAKKITATIGKKSEATRYDVSYSTNAKFKGAKTVAVKSTKTSIKATSGKKYYVKVRTVKVVGNKAYTSAWSAVKAVRVK